MNIKVSGKVPGKCVGNVVINVVKKEASSTGIWENVGSSLSVPPGFAYPWTQGPLHTCLLVASRSVLFTPYQGGQCAAVFLGNTQLTLLAWIHLSNPFSVCQDAVPKCQAFIHQMVQFLSNLEQNGKITLAVLEQELFKLLDDILVFNPPGK